MSLKYEPSSEPLHISAKELFLNYPLQQPGVVTHNREIQEERQGRESEQKGAKQKLQDRATLNPTTQSQPQPHTAKYRRRDKGGRARKRVPSRSSNPDPDPGPNPNPNPYLDPNPDLDRNLDLNTYPYPDSDS